MAAPVSQPQKVYRERDPWDSDDDDQPVKRSNTAVAPNFLATQRAAFGIFKEAQVGSPNAPLPQSTRPKPNFGALDSHLAGMKEYAVHQGPPPTPRRVSATPRPQFGVHGSVLSPLQPMWSYEVNGNAILETIGPGQTIDRFEIQHEFKKTGEFGRAFLAKILVGDGAGELRVLKFNVPHPKHGANYLERTGFEFAEYVKLKKAGFTDLATYYDFEPFINDPEVDRILALPARVQNRAFQDFLRPKLSSGYHVVEFVPDAADVPIQIKRDVATGRMYRVYKMDVPLPSDADYPFWAKVQANLQTLYRSGIASDYSITNIGLSGKYFDLRPNETDESVSVEIDATLRTYSLENSKLFKWLDPRDSSS